ncbi:MAG: endonuclease III [Armatimonadota bacterium]|nr:endonuclease III [Armatimonadota bacterium]MDR7519922.1 endonuclease III [Armatimonadota bacterium]MDR7548498.1 endonuclease III [Armatimonadota bacterium]
MPPRVRAPAAPEVRFPTGETPAGARARAAKIATLLAHRYPVTRLPLRHESPLQLLVATILSAQCTDAQVNKVTPALFARYRTAADFAAADLRELEGYIRSTGFYRQKARAIVRMARMLEERFGGVVPQTMEDLLQLPGVGRKTANVILGGAFGRPGMVVDTHVRRISRRLGLTVHGEPVRIEQDLMRLLPPEQWSDFSLRLIYFGRQICTARRPQCPTCPLWRLCPSATFAGAPPWMAARPRRRPPSARPRGRRTGRRGSATGSGRPRTAAFAPHRSSRPDPSAPG